MNKWENIGQLLLQFGLINENDLNEGLNFQKETGLRLGEALVQLRRVSMEDINWVLSKQLDIPFVIVDDVIPNNELFGKFKKEFLLINRMIPLHETDDQISIVAEDPFNETAVDVIETSLDKEVCISTGSGKKIEELLKNYYKKTVFPELISSVEDVLRRIDGTSFYRVDFILDENLCNINVFGLGILKNISTIQGTLTTQDILSVFESLNTPFLYQQYVGSRTFLALYPLANNLEITGPPAILGRFGLHLPEEITFSDADSSGLPNFFNSNNPVNGYGFYSIRQNTVFDKTFYLIDSAPVDFKDYYVNICIPKACSFCNGAGCQACKDLGYEYSEIEGLYSSDDLKKELEGD